MPKVVVNGELVEDENVEDLGAGFSEAATAMGIKAASWSGCFVEHRLLLMPIAVAAS